MKRIFPVLVLLLAAPPATARAERAGLLYDGVPVGTAETKRLHGTDYLALKPVAGMFRGKLQWYPLEDLAVLRVQNHRIAFKLESREVRIDSRPERMEAPAVIEDGSAFIPAGFLTSSSFEDVTDCDLAWNPSNLTLIAEKRFRLSVPQVFRRPGFTRIVVPSGSPLAPEVKRRGSRITVRFADANFKNSKDLNIKEGLVRRLKMGNSKRGAVLEAWLADRHSTHRWSVQEGPARLVLEIEDPSAAGAAGPGDLAEIELPRDPAAALSLEGPSLRAPKEDPARSAGAVRRIVLDPGHGGKDVGAMGKRGTKEKDVNLEIALQLARILRVQGGYEVLLTRTDDTFIPLEERSAYANRNRADLFLSIHCNASLKKKEGGFEIYFLSEKATDDQAQATADLENSVLALEKSAKPNSSVTQLLMSMARTEFINQSSLLCRTIFNAVKASGEVPMREVKQAQFHVLRGAQMPAVLVETAFITFDQEEKKLRKKAFRADMAEAIFKGIRTYEGRVKELQGKK